MQGYQETGERMQRKGLPRYLPQVWRTPAPREGALSHLPLEVGANAYLGRV